jgi:hypothetical protein
VITSDQLFLAIFFRVPQPSLFLDVDTNIDFNVIKKSSTHLDPFFIKSLIDSLNWIFATYDSKMIIIHLLQTAHRIRSHK